jgi:ABC-type nitrate/sulfonate/bicarbonate transport system substrate-binding protein
MNRSAQKIIAVHLLLALFFPGKLPAATFKKVRGAFSAFAYANPPFWIAKDLRLFEKYGLDVELVYVGGARPIQAMIGGSIDVSQVGGASMVSAAAQGAEVVILGTVFTRLVFAVHASPQIKEVSDLKGKSLAVGSVGGNSYFAGRLFLSRFNLVPNKDVLVRAVGGTPEVLTALQYGQVQAGVMAPPTTTIASRSGFRQIFDIAGLDLPFPTISVVSTRKFSAENPAVLLNVLRATSEAIYLYNTQPDLTLPIIANYMRVSKDDPALRESQQTYGRYMNQDLKPSLEGIKFILDFLAEQRPELATKKPADFVDFRFIRRLEDEGFFKKLASK